MVDEFFAVPCSDVVAELGDCVVWDHAREELLWVDIHVGRFHRGRLDGAKVTPVGSIDLGCSLGSVAPAIDGGWIVAAGMGFARLDCCGGLTWLSRPIRGKSSLRMHDGACDPAGRFWAGSCSDAGTPRAGTLYRIDADGTTTSVLRGTMVCRGLGWSLDGNTLFLADSAMATVDAFDFEPRSGTLSGRRTIIAAGPGEGVPGGLAVDGEGNIWVAFWDGGEVRCYSQSGLLLSRVRLPVSRPTNCTFGGDGLSTLFISSARFGLSADDLNSQPLSGRLFSVVPGVRGMAQPFFGGST